MSQGDKSAFTQTLPEQLNVKWWFPIAPLLNKLSLTSWLIKQIIKKAAEHMNWLHNMFENLNLPNICGL